MNRTLLTTSALALMLATAPAHAETSAEAVLETYVEIGGAVFGDALTAGQALEAAVKALIAAPSDETLTAARDAWKAARVPYAQSEVFRFGNPIVDDWEGKVNAWPLDEGLIDYVDPASVVSDENDYALLNIIANKTATIAGVEVDATTIAPELIADTLNEADGVETNVARGYHAIEFLLWGQDLNGTGPGAGMRGFADYVPGPGCTGGNCDRRADYLDAVTALLVADLAEMAANWADGGAARQEVLADPKGVLRILTGMGSLSYAEVAGERMKLGLMLNDPEEEQDCFSDATHWEHYYDALGIQNAYLGQYTRANGTPIAGAALSSLVAEVDPDLDAEMRAKLADTVVAMQAIVDVAEGGFAYDQMLAMGNAEGEALIMAGVDGLVAQTKVVERVVTALGLDGGDGLGTSFE